MARKKALALAIERQDWSLAALCLLLGVAEAAAALPPGSVEDLLELLGDPSHDRRR